ncbi:site-2 protease family protein [Halobacillus litoralis]|uniref:site-2 protease family protein n=1 Tax=Halobacillus litoralis TaxID=45668 RepID=UPI001CD2B391|nr:site-2 protease family protein [Halobacillus litoralis]MCA0970290.1 site-2 protease family protein [Halobacillus litoralis]
MILEIIVLIFWTAPLCLFIHEGGHVLAARFCKAETSRLTIGSGPKWFSLSVCRVDIHIHTIYFHGAHSMNEKSIEFSKKEKAWISLGGPFLNGLVAFLFVQLPLDFSNHLLWFMLFNAYLAIVNSIPFRYRGKKSDGYCFFRSFLT